MRHTTTAVLLACLLAGAAVGCSKSQDEIAEECQAALTSESTKTNRPDECEGLSEENYSLLLMHWALEQQGIFDENGDVDMGKLLEGATATP